ncbi:MAG: IPT/TIG domain-containing protein [Gemmatimonadetes bacterium]|nr:IPT/TIG domain-containing protein [Gemmatimonadota bacterium]
MPRPLALRHRPVVDSATFRHGARAVAGVALLLLAGGTPLAAQSIGVLLGDSARLVVAPGTRVGIPLRVDLSAAGSTLNLASLTGTLSWTTAQLTFDSVRVNAATGFTQTTNTGSAATGSATLSYFSTTRLAASGALATAWFTATGTTGSTRVAFAATAAGNEGGTSILTQVLTRGLPVCVGNSGRWGDVNDDGSVSIIDAQQIARASVGLSVASAAAVAARGDVNADGSVSIIDAQQIARFSVGLSAAARINTALFTPPAVATLTVAPTTASVAAGAAVAMLAIPRDSTSADVGGCAEVTWSSSAPAVATVRTDGVVTAVSPGTATITASSGGRTATATVTVTGGGAAAPAVTGVSPATAAPGSTLTLTGSGFGTTPAANTVTVGGVTAAVLSATATQLTVRAPCAPGGSATVVVTVDGRASAPQAMTLAVPRHTLAVGEVLLRESADLSACNELAATTGAARYLVMLYSTATSQNTLVDLQLAGNPGTGAAVRAAAPAVPTMLAAPDPAQGARDAAHLAHLERERALFARLTASGAARAPRPGAALRAVPAVGDMRTFHYNFTSCSDSTQMIRARAIYVGPRAVVWEDSANALQSAATPALAAYYTRIGRVFDRDQYEAVRTYFGDPLRRDAQTDGDGKLNMVFTQRLNTTGAAAYVTACDQFPRGANTWGSNFGENFYATVPTTAASNLNSTASPDGWYYFMARTVVHEVKHIASFAARLANNASAWEESWLEEGTARHAEEVWVRDSLHRVPWKGNTGWGTAASNGLVCDFNPTTAPCLTVDTLRRPSYGMRRQFNELLPKLTAPWNWSPYGDGTGQSGSVFYQTVWSLVRYASDRYGTTDRQFLTALNQSTQAGTANLAAVAGVPMERLIAQWGLALFTDDLPGLPAGAADLSFATWNFRSIYAGLNADPSWGGRFTTAYPLEATALTFGSFTADRTGLRGGAHAYYQLSGTPGGAQLLRLTGASGGDLPATARLAVVRLP